MIRTHITPGPRKGAPARESRTGTRLVSPAAGCQKKRHLWDLALEHEIQYIPIHYYYIIVYVQMTHVLLQLKERPKTTKKAMREGLTVAWILKVYDSGVIVSIPN